MLTTFVTSDTLVYQTFDLFGVGVVIVGVAILTVIGLLFIPIK